MKKIIQANENDKEKWNNFLEKNNGHIFQSFEYGIVRSTLNSKIINIKPLRYFFYKDNNIIGIFQILKINFFFTFFSFFYSPRGPFLIKYTKEDIKFLIQELKIIAKKHKVIFIKIDPDILISDKNKILMYEENNFFIPKNECHIFGTQPKTVFRLDLKKPLTEIEKNFHSKTRYNIKIAKNNNLIVKIGNHKKDFDQFYFLFKLNSNKKKFSIFNKKYYENLLEIFNENYCRLFIVENNNKIIAGSIIYFIGKRIWYGYGAFDLQYKNLFPNNLLHYEIIKWAKENGFEEYDFRGTGILDENNINKKDPLYGIYRFKKGFNPVFTKLISEHDFVFNKFLYFLWILFSFILKLIKALIYKLSLLQNKLFQK